MASPRDPAADVNRGTSTHPPVCWWRLDHSGEVEVDPELPRRAQSPKLVAEPLARHELDPPHVRVRRFDDLARVLTGREDLLGGQPTVSLSLAYG